MTKPSSSSKLNSARKPSKFSLLRRKLTLRKRNSPVPYTDTNDDASQAIIVQTKASKVFQRASPMKLVRLYPKMTPEQMKLIRDADYGGLVSIKCSKLHPELCKFVMKCFNPVTCELVFPGRGKIPVTESSVYDVLGVARGDLEVRYELDADAVTFMNEKLGNGNNKQPKIAYLEKKLAGMKKADSNYLRLFLTYGMSSVLAPNSSTRVSPRLYPSMVHIKHANRLNMCKFVMSVFREAAKSKAENGKFKCCQLYFMVKYLDSLELQGMNVPNEGTRVSVWTNAMVRKAINQDQRSDGTFGFAPLKAKFRCDFPLPDEQQNINSEEQEAEANIHSDEMQHHSPPTNVNFGADDVQQIAANDSEGIPECQDVPQSTILFSDPEVINTFIHMNVPPDCSPHDLVNYREAITEACHAFEAGLQMLVSKLSHKPKAKKRRKNRNKKHSSKRRKKKERTEEGMKCTLEINPPEESDEDYVCGDEDADKTQTTVSLVDETVELTGSFHYPDQTPAHDDCRFKEHIAKRRNKRQRTRDVRKCSLQSEASEESDEDYVCENEDATQTQSTVSLEEETLNLTGSFQYEDDKTNNDDYRLARRRKRAKKQECTVGTDDSDIHTSEGGLNSADGHMQQNTSAVGPQQILSNDEQVQEVTVQGTHKAEAPANLQVRTNEPEEAVEIMPAQSINPLMTNDQGNATSQGQEGHRNIKTTTFICNDRLDQERQHILSGTKTSTVITMLKDTTEGAPSHINTTNVTLLSKEGANTVEESRNIKIDAETTTENRIVTLPVEEGLRRKDSNFQSLLELVRTETSRPVIPQPDMFQLEPPVIFDFDLHRPPRHAFKTLVAGLTKEIILPSATGLPSIIHEVAREELDKLAHVMVASNVTAQTQINCSSPERCLPSPNRYRTRSSARNETSSSPINDQFISGSTTSSKGTRKTMSPAHKPTENSPRTQKKTTPSQACNAADHMQAGSGRTPSRLAAKHMDKQTSPPKTTTPTVPRSATMDSMNRKLNFDSTGSDTLEHRLARAPDPPSFDLGFDSDPTVVLCDGTTRPLTSTDLEEDANTEDKENSVQAAEYDHTTHATTSKEQPGASITPVANEYQKRVIRTAKFNRSPYIDYDIKRSFTVSRPVNELYNMVCTHGSNSTSETKDKPVIDVGSFFVMLKDLADSVSPEKKLVNVVCEVGIHVIKTENKNPKKLIMPLRMSTYLIDCRFSLKEVKKCFEFNTSNRLDHKELICFPTLQYGHYFLVNLNIKAQRFEILDSITSTQGEPVMMDACHYLIASIKKMWLKGYKASSVAIHDFPIEVIPSPQQNNEYDCGFFMLKNLEEWNGRKLPFYSQNDLPNIRKLCNDKWIRFHENKIEWKLIV